MALALGLHCIVEVGEIEYGLRFDHAGQISSPQSDGTARLVLRAMREIFQSVGYIPAGLSIHLENNIPPGSSLGGDTAALLGGAVAANVLIGSPLSREEIVERVFALERHPSAALAALLGSLVVCSDHDSNLVFAPVRVAPATVAVVLPSIPSGGPTVPVPQQVRLSDAIFNIGHTALVTQALVAGDYDLLARAMHDRLHEGVHSKTIPAYEQMLEAAHRCGAAAVTISGIGPALVAFAADNHDQIARAMARAYQKATQNKAQTWVLPVDTQGISISEMGMIFGDRPVAASDRPVSLSRPSPDASPSSNNGREHPVSSQAAVFTQS
jgi:homoserine kinase